MATHLCCSSFFFNDPATTEIYTLSLHDALPICWAHLPRHLRRRGRVRASCTCRRWATGPGMPRGRPVTVSMNARASPRSEEHTSELQSRQYLVCRLLLEKKKKYTTYLSYGSVRT